MIFELSLRNLNLNSSDCRASKIISNDTKLEEIPWELNVENPLFNFCVGVWDGGNPGANFSDISKIPHLLIYMKNSRLPKRLRKKLKVDFRRSVPRELLRVRYHFK